MPASADCVRPERPFLPQSQDDMRTYADLIRGDFEAYIADVQDYFRCVDEERARVFSDQSQSGSAEGRTRRGIGLLARRR